MRKSALSEATWEALRVLGEGYVLTRLITESQSLSWPCEPVERLESRLVPPSSRSIAACPVIHQRVARALIERQLVKPRKEQRLHDHATLTEYTISAKGSRVLRDTA
jgi:hypothetical protein